MRVCNAFKFLISSLIVDLSIASSPSAPQPKYSPQVAFQCGYRNKYLDQRTGEWISDRDSHARCLSGRLDILKYCRKIYPNLQITNFVEADHSLTIDDWCKEAEGSPCKWSLFSKPYRCLVGEFESEALLVPKGCQFGHVDDRSSCKDFAYWNSTARIECSKLLGDLHVESFSMLEPCGLDMFSGVEYVCCPSGPAEDSNVSEHHDDLNVKVQLEADQDTVSHSPNKLLGHLGEKSGKIQDNNSFGDDNDDADDVDDDEQDDSEDDSIFSPSLVTFTSKSSSTTLTSTLPPDASLHNEQPSELLDVYFRIANPEYEHERYHEALERHEKTYKNKIADANREWSELENRYQNMLKHDANQAQIFRHEMTTRFQKTIHALQVERRDQRHQIEEIHQQRVDAALNERKRDAIKKYRDALAEKKPSSARILHSLEAYIKSEEKDRRHALNNYKHLLRTNVNRALEFKPTLLRRLKNIDFRINGTISFLHNLPEKIESKVKAGALRFWQEFRSEHTPELTDEMDLNLVGSHHEKLLDLYDKQYSVNKEKFAELAVDSRDSKTDVESELKDKKSEIEAAKKVVGKLEMAIDKSIGEVTSMEPSFSEVQPDEVVAFDPIVELAGSRTDEFKESKIFEMQNPLGSYAKQNILEHQAAFVEGQNERNALAYNSTLSLVLGVTIAVCLCVLIVGVVLLKRRYIIKRQGFLEVDVCSPEERHVAMMQGNGYENPTYKYFGEKI